MAAGEAVPKELLSEVHPHFQASARNFAHYLALRRHDLRALQLKLAAMGLSSLGRSESSALATVDAVAEALRRITGSNDERNTTPNGAVDFATGQKLLIDHTDALLGPVPEGRAARIMVTMPSEAGQDFALVRDLLDSGMDCMRVNCAHDDQRIWAGMIENLRRAQQVLSKPCRVAMDLAGPKLRTGPLEPGPAVLRIRPQRDEFGRVTAAARVWLTGIGQAPPTQADAVIPVPQDWIEHAKSGNEISFTDARDSKRKLKIVDVAGGGVWAEANQTCYISGDVVLKHGSRKVKVAGIPPSENAMIVNPGDTLRITRDLRPGRAAAFDSRGQVLTPAQIGCTIPEVFSKALPGQPISFDDGTIDGIIERVEDDCVTVRIRQTPFGGRKLKADKGINLPETDVQLSALTPKDLEDLAFAAKNADIVELSFANCAEDVEQLQQRLKAAGGEPGIVLKVETRRGFENLPEMLLTAMRWPACGVMIARGDLAVECGFERLAEAQEEILWLCEAAHVPAIWATQVLETLAKEGIPSRAEITDAAMGHRAECVMLNKGPYVVRAVEVLDDILRRMQTHQAKKRSMLRQLQVADALTA
jgi:pyruvate kinase